MYAKLNNGQLQKYPYTMGMLRKDNHNVSFPKVMTDEIFAQFGVVRVTLVSPPTISHTQVWHESTPVLENGVWKQAYSISDISAEDLATRTENQANNARAERNQKLSQSDWTQGKDIADEVSTAWATYRQALRDIPSQVGFPWDVTWPDQPE
jgi:hypothetical protein